MNVCVMRVGAILRLITIDNLLKSPVFKYRRSGILSSDIKVS